MTANCINLRERFGDRFKVRYVQDYFAEYGPNAQTEDPVYMEVPCANGFIAPWSGTELVACTARAGAVARKLGALPFTTVVQDGDDGANVAFPVERFEEVAAVMKPRRRRRLSPTARRRLAEAGVNTRFKSGIHGPHTARPCVPRALPDSAPVDHDRPLLAALEATKKGAGPS